MTNKEAIEKLERHKMMNCHGCVHPSMVGWCEKHCQLPEAFDMAIKALTAQEVSNDSPELDKENGELIRRKAAIEVLKEAFNPSITNFVKAKIAIENLPSAQPEPSRVARDIATIIENEKDMRVIAQPEPEITDEQAIEHLQSSGWMQNHDKQMYEMGAKEQPQRTGRWIQYGDEFCCSECGGWAYMDECDEGIKTPQSKFCPECGARMEESEE